MSLHVETLERELAAENPYLGGPYEPTRQEVTLTDLEVVGEIPDDLNGVYVRNGPNPQFDPRGRYHWFDGDGMVHALHLADGRASYRNRWIRTEAFELERQAEEPIWSGIIEPFSENPPDAPEKDTANTDVIFHNDHLLALWYRAGKPYALDPVTLETVGSEDFGGTLRCEVSAHAKVDERTGELFFFDYGFTPPFMRYGVVGPDGLVRHFVPIDLPGPRLPHDMAITEKHAILMDLPLYNEPEAARAGASSSSSTAA
jgi:carotenoid cleavage dioxygenase